MSTSGTFADGDRVSHAVKGTGTVKTEPAEDDLVVPRREEAKSGPDLVYVVWDDDRFPVGKVDAAELERLAPGAAAISPGY
jgi:hypothetical protein